MLFKCSPFKRTMFKCFRFQLKKNKYEATLHTSSHKLMKKEDCREIEIPVPWGHIAGKWWGKPDTQPIVALHGVQDNAATFDRLVPLLVDEAVLALDMPGHGRSSHIPKGLPYHFMDGVCLIRFVISDYFKWKQPIKLLGHSFGSALSFVYAAVFPDEVLNFVSIDCSRHQMTVLPNRCAATLKETLNKIIDYEDKQPPEYTFDELLEKFHKGHKSRLNKETCKILLSRGTTALSNGKVYFSRDVRLKLNACERLTLEDLLELASDIKCHVLSIQAENGIVKNDIKGDIYRKTVEIMMKNSTKSEHVLLEGNHHLHLDNPVPVANEINRFLVS